MIQKLLNIELLKPHLNQKLTEIKEYNHNLPNQNHDINSRRLSNIGLFRAYTEAYLRENQHIAQDMTFIVRQLEAKQFGLPIQIYVFTNDTNWVNYEAIQSDIFDHLFAVVPYFELKIYQATTGRMDIQN